MIAPSRVHSLDVRPYAVSTLARRARQHLRALLKLAGWLAGWLAADETRVTKRLGDRRDRTPARPKPIPGHASPAYTMTALATVALPPWHPHNHGSSSHCLAPCDLTTTAGRGAQCIRQAQSHASNRGASPAQGSSICCVAGQLQVCTLHSRPVEFAGVEVVTLLANMILMERSPSMASHQRPSIDPWTLFALRAQRSFPDHVMLRGL